MPCPLKRYEDELVAVLDKRSTKSFAAFLDKWAHEGFLERDSVRHFKASSDFSQMLTLCKHVIAKGDKVTEETRDWASEWLSKHGYLVVY